MNMIHMIEKACQHQLQTCVEEKVTDRIPKLSKNIYTKKIIQIYHLILHILDELYIIYSLNL